MVYPVIAWRIVPHSNPQLVISVSMAEGLPHLLMKAHAKTTAPMPTKKKQGPKASKQTEHAVESKPRRRIVLTGGPGGGKTTAVDLFRREMGERVVVVPEAATLLFSGGFPRSTNLQASTLAQQSIFNVQRHLEDVQSVLYPDRILLCDRGTIDGAAYYPHGADQFFSDLNTSYEAELARYDGVIFFESAAVGHLSIEGGNPIRNESMEQAVALDAKLRALWMKHPCFILVRHNASFFKKIALGLAELDLMINEAPLTNP